MAKSFAATCKGNSGLITPGILNVTVPGTLKAVPVTATAHCIVTKVGLTVGVTSLQGEKIAPLVSDVPVATGKIVDPKLTRVGLLG